MMEKSISEWLNIRVGEMGAWIASVACPVYGKGCHGRREFAHLRKSADCHMSAGQSQRERDTQKGSTEGIRAKRA